MLTQEIEGKMNIFDIEKIAEIKSKRKKQSSRPMIGQAIFKILKKNRFSSILFHFCFASSFKIFFQFTLILFHFCFRVFDFFRLFFLFFFRVLFGFFSFEFIFFLSEGTSFLLEACFSFLIHRWPISDMS